MASGSDFLSRGPNHGQESTSYSDTDTVHGSHHIKHSKTTASGTSTFEASQSTFSGDICPPVIPLPLTGKTLVVCFDGTGDQFDLDNSSIVQLFSLLQKDDKTKQMVYYQAGIGTYSGSYKVPQPWLSGIRKTWDLMFAHSIHSHVMSGYEFLMQNYQHGDRICLFGFSRGAFTAWSLAGMIKKVGLLPADNHEQIPFAYKMWTLTDTAGKEQAKEFKKAFSINVNIEFIGVWDTVRSVGIKKVLPDVDSKTIANTVRHAVSLDERRGKFKPDLFLPPAHKKTSIEEVWFAGCHCDVGGGSVSNKTRHSLARIPLRWMIREIFKANAGILFLSDELPSIGMDPRTLYPEVQLRPKPLPSKGLTLRKPPVVEPPIRLYSWLPHFRLNSWLKGQTEDTDSNLAVSSAPVFLGSEEEEELRDALSPVYDQLWLAKSWWVLEWLPVYLYRRVKDQWVGYFKFNRGRPRKIPKQSTKGLKVHRSVRQRMEAEHDDDKRRAKGERYMPRTKWTVMPTWID